MVEEMSYPVTLDAPRVCRRCVYFPVPQARSVEVSWDVVEEWIEKEM
jgi:hypothetical protein